MWQPITWVWAQRGLRMTVDVPRGRSRDTHDESHDDMLPPMKLLTVNVALPRDITVKGKTVRTSIFKEPVTRRVQVKTLDIEGNGQADLIGHGGEMRAVLVYSFENYAHWETELGRTDFRFGQFGENFTVEGMLDDEIQIGDRFRIGTAVFEVTQPRVPCYKLGIKMRTEGFYSRLLRSGRPGFYFRVLEQGEVGPGDIIHRLSTHPVGMTVRQISNLLYFEKNDLDGARRALRIESMSPGWRQSFETRLAKATLAGAAGEPLRSLEVTRKVRESENATSFYLIPVDSKPLAPFLPGQFLPLKLDIPGQYQPVLRTYSLSDSPSANHYRLTIQASGRATRSTGCVPRCRVVFLPRPGRCRLEGARAVAPGEVSARPDS